LKQSTDKTSRQDIFEISLIIEFSYPIS